MNNGLVKKLRKYATKNYKINLGNVLETVCAENIFHRVAFAFKVIFKVYKKNKSINKNKITSKD